MSQINVNNIRAKDGVGPVGFPGGINATGVVTATTFKGALEGNVTGNVTGTASNATVAEGLTGTPNITVGTVIGTDATFSGDLTVNGTTTTIDTAVTAVDSLAVDGQITSSSIGIGTASPSELLHVSGTSNPSFQLTSTNDTTPQIKWSTNSVDRLLIDSSSVVGARVMVRSNQQLTFGTNNTERLRIDQHGTSKFKGPLTEKCNRDTGAGLSGDYNHDLISHGNVHWATSNSASTWTYNLRGNATVALNDMMTDGETLSFQLITGQNNSSNYMTQFRIDGSGSHNVYWSGGSAPSAGGSGGYDVYTFTVFKIGDASFRTFASLTNHA